jgi:hypothetical protein
MTMHCGWAHSSTHAKRELLVVRVALGHPALPSAPVRSAPTAFMEYEKGGLVGNLRGATECKRKKVEGRKSRAELWPQVVVEARRLRNAKGKAGRLS